MSYGQILVTAPTEEPVTLPEAKKQCEVPDAVTAHDAKIGALVTAARLFVEQQLNRQLVTATWKLILDRFPCSNEPIYIPRAPLASVTSILYLDGEGDSTTWTASDYRVSTSCEPGRIVPAFGETYPSTRNTTDAITIQYVAGYGAASAVPVPLKQAILLLVAHWFENREAVGAGSMAEVPMAVGSLLDAYRTGDEFTCYGPEAYAAH